MHTPFATYTSQVGEHRWFRFPNNYGVSVILGRDETYPREFAIVRWTSQFSFDILGFTTPYRDEEHLQQVLDKVSKRKPYTQEG